VRWANVQAIDVKFSQDSTHQKSLKVDFFGTQCSFKKQLSVDLEPETKCVHVIVSLNSKQYMTEARAHSRDQCRLGIGDFSENPTVEMEPGQAN